MLGVVRGEKGFALMRFEGPRADLFNQIQHRVKQCISKSQTGWPFQSNVARLQLLFASNVS